MRQLVMLSFFAAATAAGQTLTASERAVASAVDANNRQALALLERVVNINSGTNNVTGVRAVGDIFTSEFKALGFATRWEPSPPDHAAHLVAEHKGSGPKILLIGHLDTVFEPSSPFQKF